MSLSTVCEREVPADALIQALESHGWALQDDFVSCAMAGELLQEAREFARRERFRPAVIGRGAQRQLNPVIRGDQIAWLEPGHMLPAQARYLAMLETLRTRINRDLQLGLFDLEAHLACYAPGSGYQKHTDNFQGNNARILSVVLYLNVDWQTGDGGQLRLYLAEDSAAEVVDIEPLAGRLAVLLSRRFPHEVLPSRRERFSITGWFRQRA
jgi:SM-20-related protein